MVSRIAIVLYAVCSITLQLRTCAGFITAAPRRLNSMHVRTDASVPKLSKDKATDSNSAVEFKSNNPLELAAWYGVEVFGKIFSKKNSNSQNGSTGDIDLTKAPSSLKETLERIQLDNDRYYFLSGELDRLIYDQNCVFADPFVSFNGRDRFIDNLSNLGSFITNYNAKMISYEVNDDGSEINTKVMVKLELNLPWKPVLAWPWGVRYDIDPATYLITSHVESWDIQPWEGVKQIFRKPTVKIS